MMPHIIFMLGAADVGKTYMTTRLANAFFMRGFNVAVVDADIGQSDIGPPCCVGVGMMNEEVRFLHEIPLSSLFFVGSTSPMRCTRECICGTVAGVRRAKELGAEVIIVDSTGWVIGNRAVEFKMSEIMHAKPSFIIAIEHENELQPIISLLLDHHTETNDARSHAFIVSASSYDAGDIVDIMLSASSATASSARSDARSNASAAERASGGVLRFERDRMCILRLKASENVRRKRRLYRRRSREIAFNRYFKYARNRLFSCSLFDREPSQIDEGLICGVFADASHHAGSHHAETAMCDDIEVIGIGVLRRVDRRSGIAAVLTPVNEDVAFIKLGMMRLWRVRGRLKEFRSGSPL